MIMSCLLSGPLNVSNLHYEHINQTKFIAWELPHVLEKCGSISSNAMLRNVTTNEVVRAVTAKNMISLSMLHQDHIYKLTIWIVTNYSSEEELIHAFIVPVDKPSTGNSKGELEFIVSITFFFTMEMAQMA